METDMHRVIRTQDWDVPDFMGLDRIPTGGRYPGLRQASGDDNSGSGGERGRARSKRPVRMHTVTAADPEGVLVVDLLEGWLEKNAAKRITLEQVKVRRRCVCRCRCLSCAPG